MIERRCKCGHFELNHRPECLIAPCDCVLFEPSDASPGAQGHAIPTAASEKIKTELFEPRCWRCNKCGGFLTPQQTDDRCTREGCDGRIVDWNRVGSVTADADAKPSVSTRRSAALRPDSPSRDLPALLKDADELPDDQSQCKRCGRIALCRHHRTQKLAQALASAIRTLQQDRDRSLQQIVAIIGSASLQVQGLALQRLRRDPDHG